MWGRIGKWLGGAALVTLMIPAAAGAQASVSSAYGFTIPASGNATPYPGDLTYPGFGSGVIDRVNVGLINFNHTFPDDVDILLTGPGGQTAVLMSDACGGGDLTGANFTFDDAAAPLSDAGPCAGGTYKPTDYSDVPADAWPGAPAGPYGTSLSVFNGTNPIGTWKLWVRDDTNPDGGSIGGGWVLTITEHPVSLPKRSSAFQLGKPKGNRKGVVTIPVTVPNSGIFSVEPTGKTRGLYRSELDTEAKSAGPVSLVVRPNRAGRRALREPGRLKAKFSVTFMGGPGDFDETSQQVKLKVG